MSPLVVTSSCVTKCAGRARRAARFVALKLRYCYNAIMPRATLIFKDKEIRADGSIVEVVVWELSEPVPPCVHRYKYRLYFGAEGVCRVRYDNERGKGDHRHRDGVETVYRFSTLAALVRDFRQDIANWRASA